MAQEWDSGVLPYRDIRSYNFPGHIYLHWILGKLFGWGHMSVFYAVDAMALLLLGAIVIAWSRRRLGQSLPGTAAYLIFLAYYLDASFDNVAQRDWHSPLCATLGLLLLETWPGRHTRWLSALLAAMAFTIRPQVVLFLPALLVAAVSGDIATRGTSSADDARMSFQASDPAGFGMDLRVRSLRRGRVCAVASFRIARRSRPRAWYLETRRTLRRRHNHAESKNSLG